MPESYKITKLYFQNYESKYNWLHIDNLQLGNDIMDYRISSRIVYYDDSNKALKCLLPKTNWTMVRINRSPIPALCIHLIMFNKNDFMLYNTTDACNAEIYMDIMNKLGIIKKSVYRLGVWFKYFMDFCEKRAKICNEKRENHEKRAFKVIHKEYKPVIESIIDNLFTDYVEKDYIEKDYI